MIDEGKHNVLGILVNAIDYEAAVEKIVDAAKERRGFSVSALAVHGLMTGVLDREIKYRLNHFDLLCPDGQPVRWALRFLAGKKLDDRVYGPFLTIRTCQRAAEEKLKVFCFGSSEEVLAEFTENLKVEAPGLEVVGSQPSRFRQATEDEVAEDVETIRNSGADICLVGLGCPRQEVWCFEMKDRIEMPMLAVGAAFDFYAGNLPMAPAWMQASGLEWLFRLKEEPRRLWSRYLCLNPLYLGHLFIQWAVPGRYQPTDGLGTPPSPCRYG